MSAPMAGTQHHYNGPGVYNACLRIYKYLNSAGTDSLLTGQACRTINLQNTNTPPDSCKANFIDTIHTTVVLTYVFKAVPWHNNNKKPNRYAGHLATVPTPASITILPSQPIMQ
jgi:hypothetical protein